MKQLTHVLYIIAFSLLVAEGLTLNAAELKLACLFTDHAVLQCDAAVPVWGWADAGTEVTVEFAGQKKTCLLYTSDAADE